MGAPARPRGSAGYRRAGRPDIGRRARALPVVAALVTLGSLGVLLVASLPPALGGTPFGPTGGPLRLLANGAPVLSLGNASVASSPSTTFFGANVRPYNALGSFEGSTFAASGLQFARWPGGAVADRLNITSNRVYNDDATWYVAPENLSEFAAWCHQYGCHAIVGLPAEIDDPATAAYYVSYAERTVGFHPDFWEIGNEPTVWTHFGVPWAGWNVSQAVNATPSVYASLLHQYIAAIRAVDPTARFVGLGGLGTGSWGETTWITAVVRANGPNLSAVSIHVYPAGGTTTTNATLPEFFGTLTGASSLASRVPSDRAAIAAACRTCHIDVIASELGSGTDGGPFDPYMASFPVLPFLAAEYAQALQLNLSQVDLFSFEGTYDGSILNESGAPTSVATLYSTFLAPLRTQVLAANLTNLAKGFYVLATRSPSGGPTAILLANVNTSASFSFQIALPGGGAHVGSYTTWLSGQAAPVTSSWTTAGPSSFRVAPDSLAILRYTGGIVFHGALPSPPGPSFGVFFPIPPATVPGILSLAAPTSMTFPCWAVASTRLRERFWPRGGSRPPGPRESASAPF